MMARPDPNDGDNWRAYAIISNAVLHAECDMGKPMRLLLSERERIAERIWDELAGRGYKVVWNRCGHTSEAQGRCKLKAGHPEGPWYNLFSDHGHLYEESTQSDAATSQPGRKSP